MTKKTLLSFTVMTCLIWIFIMIFSISTSQAATLSSTRYEAEDAYIFGSSTADEYDGYSGTGYVNCLKENSDYIEFTVDVDTTGFYSMYIGFCACNGYKQETITINGTQSFSATFEENNVFEKSNAYIVKLQAGKNFIRISRFWGYTLLDYIDIEKADNLSFNLDVSDELINPNATNEAKKLMTYLTSIYGKNILSGQFAYANKYSELQAIYDNTGKYPAVIGLDLSDYSPSRASMGAVGQDTDMAINYWNEGGIVTMCWHWGSPTGGVTEGDAKWGTFYTKNTSFDLSVAMSDKSSEEYTTLISDIDTIAIELQKLQDAGVPILWRPLHEASGGWFWWGAAGSEPYKELWKLMYDRLTNYHHLNNLIWVWNGQGNEWYPGDNYVDIIGEDIYASKQDYSSQINGFLKASSYTNTNKMITLSENGVLLDPDELVEDKVPWSWLCTWGGEFVIPAVGSTDYSETYTSLELLKKFYAHDYVITKDELPSSLFNKEDTTGSGETITDSTLSVKNPANESTSGNISLGMEITNNGESLDLSKLEIRYYYTKDNLRLQKVLADHIAIQYTGAPWYATLTNSAQMTAVTMSPAQDGADSYASIKFNTDVVLEPNSTLIFQGKIVKSDWSLYNLSNDFSGEHGISVFYDGKLIYGTDL